MGFPGGSEVKASMQETWIQSLSQEDPLEKEMATHSSILAWRIPWRRSLVGYSPWDHKELDTIERLHSLTHSLRDRYNLCNTNYAKHNFNVSMIHSTYGHVDILVKSIKYILVFQKVFFLILFPSIN